jgi:hypothetical protein
LSLSADSASNKTPEAKKLIYISLIMIFMAHATITDASQNKRDLSQVFKSSLPSLALRQMAEFALQMTDRIITIPSVW